MSFLPLPDNIRINNAAYSWNSCKFFLDVLPFVGVTDCSFDQKIEREKVWAALASGAPIGITDGKFDANLKITFLRKSFYDVLLPYLSKKGLLSGGIGWGRVGWDFQLQYTHRQIGSHTISFVDCKVGGHTEPNAVGSQPLVTELEIHVMDILLDGISMHSAGLLGP